jgi:hypothetical protein
LAAEEELGAEDHDGEDEDGGEELGAEEHDGEDEDDGGGARIKDDDCREYVDGEDLVAPLLNLSVDSPQDPKRYRCEWIG